MVPSMTVPGVVVEVVMLEQVRVLILTTYDTDAYVFEALEAGASGFLLKDSGPAELLHALRVVAAGEALLAPRITRRLIGQFTAARTAHQFAEDRLAVLTQREREVLALVGEGLSNQEIAARLVLSPATARTHVSRAMVKLRARDRAQLVVVAHQTGLVGPAHAPDCPATTGLTEVLSVGNRGLAPTVGVGRRLASRVSEGAWADG
jgi:DNA-binding NarL/FixJ family response regulator